MRHLRYDQKESGWPGSGGRLYKHIRLPPVPFQRVFLDICFVLNAGVLEKEIAKSIKICLSLNMDFP